MVHMCKTCMVVEIISDADFAYNINIQLVISGPDGQRKTYETLSIV